MHVSSHCICTSQKSAAMAQPLPRFLSRRFCQQSSLFTRASNTFRSPIRNSPARRSYATGESGPNPRPGQSPFKVWPFVAITVAGSGAYILMVRSRTGTEHAFLFLNCDPSLLKFNFESRFNSQRFKPLYSTLALHHVLPLST
jgi:hypothetical protein